MQGSISIFVRCRILKDHFLTTMRKLYQLFVVLLLSIFVLCGTNSVNAQLCVLQTNWTFNPPIPPSGSYDAGTTIQICGTITNYLTSGANWIHGIEFNFPPAYDISSIVVVNAPQQCSGNNGIWMWMPNTFLCQGLNVGPGFFYDVNSGGPQDGNPCNNYGDPCFGTNANWSWCLQVTLSAACGGPGNPLDGSSIVPQIQVWGDGDTGSWGPTTGPCNGIGVTNSPNVTMNVNCCDAESGVSPGTVPICQNGIVNLTSLLLPPVQTTNATWSGPNGPVPTGTFNPLNPIASPPGVYTYSATGSNGCINTTSLTMAYNTLGIIAYPAYCSLAPVALMTLQNNPSYILPPGGTWTNPAGIVIPTGILNPNLPPTNIPGQYTYTYFNSNNCQTTAILSISLNTGGSNAGCPTTIDVCSLDPPFVLLDQLACGPVAGGQWLHVYVGPPSPGFVAYYTNAQGIGLTINPANLAQNSTFTYAIGDPPCTPSFADLTVNINFPVNAGVFTQANVCVTDAPFCLETLLNPGSNAITPGLNWATNAGVPLANCIFNPATITNPPQTILLNYSGGLANTGCFAFNVLELTVLPANANAGASTTITVCETDPGFQLFDLLDVPINSAQPGGIFTGPAPSTAFFNGFFIPGTTLPGLYTYTVTSTCDTDQATVNVTVLPLPIAGTNGTLNICSNAGNVNLFTGLGGTPAIGGTWTLSGAPVSNIVNGATVTNGAVYTYLVGSGNCSASATVTINLTIAPFAGTATAVPQLYCSTDPALSLFTLLAPPPNVVNGTFWAGPGSYTGANFNPASPLAVTGNYTYTIPNNGCGTDSETIFITVETTPNAGNNATATLCPNATVPTNLFTLLGGGVTTGGTWTAPPSGPTNGIFTPGSPAGTYTYSVSSPSGQCNDQATVTVTLQNIPSAGSNGAITVCSNATPFPLISVLGSTPAPPTIPTPAAANWFNPSSTIVPGAGNAQFTPGTSQAGVYTYIIPVAGCPVVSATATITVVPPPNAGTNTTTNLCSNLGSIDLTSYLNGTPQTPGNWFQGATPIANPFNISALGGTTQVFTYNVNNGTCSSSSTLTINVQNPPIAGPDVTTNLCATGAAFNLNTILHPTAQTGGAWTNPAPVSGGTIILNAAASGVYTYTLAGTACASDVALYTLNITNPITATVTSTCNAAQTGYTVEIVISGGNGTGTGGSGTGNYIVNGLAIMGSTFVSALINTPNNFSFSVDDTGPCPAITASGAAPICICPATATFSGGNQSICLGGSIGLPVTLTGSGNWTLTYNDGTANSTATLNASGQTINVSPTVTTIYTLVSLADANCTSPASGSVTVTVVNPPNAGPDVTTNLCTTGANLVLNTILNASAQLGGTWANSGGTPVTSIPVSVASSGAYTYTVASAPCPSDAALYTIIITDPISVTAITTACNPAQTNYTVSFNITGGTGSGTYSVNGNTIPGSAFTSALLPLSNYSFSVDDQGPCPAVVINGAAPNCSCPATASFSSGNQTICNGSSASLVISTAGSGPWQLVYSANGVNQPTVTINTSGGTITVSPTVNTTYALISVSDVNCAGSAAGSLTVNVVNSLNAGPDVTSNLCATGATLILNSLLNLSADLGGTWTNAGGSTVTSIPVTAASSGVYTYTVTSAPCPSDFALYTINITTPLAVTGLTAICNAAQTGYTLSFTITGGAGGITVTSPVGLTGTLVGNTFTSALINTGNNYAFDVSDTSICADLPVNGVSPNCNCNVTGSISGTTNICSGNCATITFNLQGSEPFEVVYQNSNDPFNPVLLTGIFNGHTITVCPSATSTYTLLTVTDNNCTGVVQGNAVVVTVNPPVTVSNITETCNVLNENYTVTFTVTGGVPPIVVTATGVTPPAGNFNAGTGLYTSAPIPTGTNYSFSVSNGGACPAVVVSGSFSCGCTTDAGTIQTTPIVVCTNETAQVVPTSGPTLDANDIFQYILHNGSSNTLGTILATSATGAFNFGGGLVAGQTYFITAIAGNSNGQGGVNQNDPCFSASLGVSVVFNALPTASISGNSTLCPGSVVNFNVNFTGTGPWDYSYTINGNGATLGISESNSTTISGNSPGAYVIQTVTDNNCVGTASGVANLNNFTAPTAIMTGDPNVCTGSGDGPEIAFTGQGPWTFTYALDGAVQNNITTSFPTFTIPAQSSGLYSMVSVQDANCSGAASGLLAVNVIVNPTAQITGGGTVCQGNTASFTLQLTGNGPFNVLYSVGGVPQSVLNGVMNGHTFQSGVAGNYNVITVTDQVCTGQGTGGNAQLQVNPLPHGEILTNSNLLCTGQELSLTFNMEGTPPYNITYVIDGDTISLNGVPNNFTQILSPNAPVVASLIFVQDSSNPSCVSNTPASAFVQVGELPNAPVLTDYTICSGSEALSIGAPPVSGLSYSWSPTTGLSDANVSSPSIQLAVAGVNPRTFIYTLTTTNGECEAIATSEITVDPGPRANFSFSPNPISSIDPTVRFQNLSDASETTGFYWEFDIFGTSIQENPTFKFPEGIEATYTVILNAVDLLTGCSDTHTNLIKVRPEMLVFVPNAFTPDGDGINDLWGPVMANIDENEYRLSVFDRTGRIIFQTLDPDKKWNGSIDGGDFYAQNAVYVWLIETKNKLTSDELEFRGLVTVIR